MAQVTKADFQPLIDWLQSGSRFVTHTVKAALMDQTPEQTEWIWGGNVAYLVLIGGSSQFIGELQDVFGNPDPLVVAIQLSQPVSISPVPLPGNPQPLSWISFTTNQIENAIPGEQGGLFLTFKNDSTGDKCFLSLWQYSSLSIHGLRFGRAKAGK
jgi:hypothetical protein